VSDRIGVDIGGTFADFCALDEATGLLATLKVLSTPEEPGREVMAGLAELGSRFGIQAQDIGYFGKVSTQAAADAYGVVIRDGGIDETATAARRSRLAANAKPGVFAFNQQREAYEREWTDANYAALTELLATLAVNWRHYMNTRIFAALEQVPVHQRRGDGSEVRRAFELAVGEFPQLKPAQAAE